MRKRKESEHLSKYSQYIKLTSFYNIKKKMIVVSFVLYVDLFHFALAYIT